VDIGYKSVQFEVWTCDSNQNDDIFLERNQAYDDLDDDKCGENHHCRGCEKIGSHHGIYRIYIYIHIYIYITRYNSFWCCCTKTDLSTTNHNCNNNDGKKMDDGRNDEDFISWE
jgi:hypothetical protein